MRNIALGAACLLGIGALVGVVHSVVKDNNNVVAASAKNDDFDGNEIHFWTVNHTSGSSSGIWQWSGSFKKGYENSKIQVNANSSFTFTLKESNINAYYVVSYKFRIYVGANMKVEVKRGSTSLFSKTATSSHEMIDKSSSFNSLAGSGDFTFTITNNNSSLSEEIYFDSVNLKVYASQEYAATIAAGTGVSSVYLSTSSSATSGSSSGTKFENGKTVYGFAVLKDGYNPASGWTKVSGNKYRVGSRYIDGSSVDFGTQSTTSKITYSISYNLNGGSVSGTNPTSYNVETASFTLTNPTKTGYSFTGWSGTGISGTSTSVTVSKGSIGDRSYTANWNANKYTVAYNKNQPSNASSNVSGMPSNATWTYDADGTLGAAPSLTGWTFGGWYKEASCTNKVGNGGQKLTKPNLTATNNATVNLYAKWTANTYTVTYNGNKPAGAPSGAEVTNLPADATWTYDNISAYTLGAAPTFVDGYTFMGWYKEASCSTKVGDAGESLTKPNLTTVDNATVTLYAKWVFDENVQAVVDKINDIGDVDYPDSKQDIIDAEDAYNGLSDNYKAVIDSEGYKAILDDARSEYEDQRSDARQEVIDAIEAIGEVSYPDSKEDILDAEALYAALDDDDKNVEFIPNQQTMFDDRSAYEGLREDARQEVITAIEAIGDISYPGSKEALVHAEELYDALDDDDKNSTFITNQAVKEAARDAYNGQRVDAVNAVIAEINKINQPFDENRETQINSADTMFNALDEDEQNSTWVTNLARLQDAHKADEVADMFEALGPASDTDEFRNKVEAARDAYIALTDNQEAFISSDLLNLLEEREAAIIVMDTINAIGDPHWTSESKALIDAANNAYNQYIDNGYPHALIANYQTLVDANTDYNNVQSFVDKVNNIAPVEYTEACKELIDLARDYFEDGLDTDQQGIVHEDAQNYYQLLVDYEKAYEAMRLIDAIGDMENDPECGERIEAARDYLDSLDPNTQLPLVDTDLIKVLEDDEAAWEVIITINDLFPMEYGQAQVDAINEARSDYNALSEDQQDLVVNYDMLQKAETDYAAVEAVVTLINNIGDIRFNEESDNKIVEARTAYENLEDDQKAFFPEDVLQSLEDYEKAWEALERFYAIGEVTNDTESADRIQSARDFYDSLTDEQKELIDVKDFSVLSSAEDRYAEIKKENQTLVISLLVVVSLVLLGGLFFLFLLLKRKKDKDDEDKGNKKGTVKAMSVSGLVLLSNFFGTPFIILYVIAGIAALIWIANLVITVRRKINKKNEKVLSSNEEEEVETVTDEKGNVFQIRYVKSFTAKLIQSPKETKKYYEELKNEVLSYKKTNSRISWHYDAINAGRDYVLKFAVRGKTLCVYLPLDADKLEEKYKVEKVESKKFEDTPCLYRIKNDRRLGYAKDLIAMVAAKLGLEKGEEQHEVYSNLPYEENKPLVAKGLIKEQKVQINKPAESQIVESKVNADGDEIVVERDSSGNLVEIRFIKSFTAKLSQAEDVTKNYYNILKNYVLSYKDTHSRVSWHYDAFNIGRDYILKFAIRGKTLCVFYALDASKLDDKYKVETAKGKKYEDVPCLYRIKNDRRCEYAKELIDLLMKKLKVEKGKELNDDYRIPYQDTKKLLAKGLIKEVKTKIKGNEEALTAHEHFDSISVSRADETMSDEAAEHAIEMDTVHHHQSGSKEVINIDTLSQNFNDGDIVDLEALKKKKLVSSKCGYVKVLARGTLDKRLIVDLDDYSIQAVKMIVLMDGHAKKIK